AGLTAAELNQILAPQGQWVPLDVPRPETTTLGAILAAHLSGPLRQRYGTVRDFTLGLEMVASDGSLVHSGGRVVKNVAGYDWMKLAIGGRGALGIITGVNFKVFPLPGASLTAGFNDLSWIQVEAIRGHLLRSHLRPQAVELWAPAGERRAVWVRCAGSEAVLARYRRELEACAAVAKCAVEFMDPGPQEAALWD